MVCGVLNVAPLVSCLQAGSSANHDDACEPIQFFSLAVWAPQGRSPLSDKGLHNHPCSMGSAKAGDVQ